MFGTLNTERYNKTVKALKVAAKARGKKLRFMGPGSALLDGSSCQLVYTCEVSLVEAERHTRQSATYVHVQTSAYVKA
jgi:hypothetical protein